MSAWLKSNIQFLIAHVRDCLKSGLKAEWQLDSLGVDRIFWGERGTGSAFLVDRLNKFCAVKQASVLIEGIGKGKQVNDFLPYRPRMVVGCDVLCYNDEWNLMKKKCADHKVAFCAVQNDIRSLCFSDESFDIVASFAVYEHVANLEEALKEGRRVLKKGGTLMAAIGPLYYCFGGDHFSGHGGVRHGYNHLSLEKNEYVTYFDSYSYQLGDEKGGYRRNIIEYPLFSYLKFNDYLVLFDKYFKRVSLATKVSPEALMFKKQFTDQFKKLQDDFGLAAYDLIIKGIIVYLKKATDVA